MYIPHFVVQLTLTSKRNIMIRVSYDYSGNLVSFTFLSKAIFATEVEDIHLDQGRNSIDGI
jgi:hypothetical protein